MSVKREFIARCNLVCAQKLEFSVSAGPRNVNEITRSIAIISLMTVPKCRVGPPKARDFLGS